MIKLVAFDWNGTLLDDVVAGAIACSGVNKHFGFNTISIKQLRDTFTIPLRDFWITSGFEPLVFDKEFQTIQKVFVENYGPLERKCRARTGAKNALMWLKENKVSNMIFSNHTIPDINIQLQRLNLSQYIDYVTARTLDDISHSHKKTKHKKLSDYVKSLNLKPDQVVTIGDTIEEVEIGKKYGYHTVAITGGWQSIIRLKATKPDFIISNLSELKKIISKL